MLGLYWLIGGLDPVAAYIVTWIVMRVAGETTLGDDYYMYSPYSVNVESGWEAFVTPIVQIVLGIALIVLSRRIAGWMGFGEGGHAESVASA